LGVAEAEPAHRPAPQRMRGPLLDRRVQAGQAGRVCGLVAFALVNREPTQTKFRPQGKEIGVGWWVSENPDELTDSARWMAGRQRTPHRQGFGCGHCRPPRHDASSADATEAEPGYVSAYIAAFSSGRRVHYGDLVARR